VSDAPIAFVYRSTASPYFPALNATFPCSLTFSARLMISSGSCSTGGGEGGSPGLGDEGNGVAEPEAVGSLTVAAYSQSKYFCSLNNKTCLPAGIAVHGHYGRNWGSCSLPFLRGLCLLVCHDHFPAKFVVDKMRRSQQPTPTGIAPNVGYTIKGRRKDRAGRVQRQGTPEPVRQICQVREFSIWEMRVLLVPFYAMLHNYRGTRRDLALNLGRCGPLCRCFAVSLSVTSFPSRK
jgi:hypothetical protein